MTASQIISEIKQLSPSERAEVETFIRHDDTAARLSAAELGALAEKMVKSDDDSKAADFEEQIVAGFYGTK